MVDTTSHNIIVRGVSNKNGISPLIIVDGKEIPNDELGKLNPDNIYSVNVIKDEKSTSLYGEKGKKGVVSITTKGNSISIEGKPSNEVKVIGYDTQFYTLS